MSQAPTPLEPTVEAMLRRRPNRRRARSRQNPTVEAAPAAQIPEFLARRQSVVSRPRRRVPVRSFGLGIALGFLLGQQHGVSLPLGPALASLGQLQQPWTALLQIGRAHV